MAALGLEAIYKDDNNHQRQMEFIYLFTSYSLSLALLKDSAVFLEYCCRLQVWTGYLNEAKVSFNSSESYFSDVTVIKSFS